MIKLRSFFPFSRSEWRWVILWAAAVLLVTSLPYLVGLLLATPELSFSGLIIGVEDGYSYLSKMRMGAEGSWVFYLYTTEPHPGVYLYTFHLLLGKIAALTGLPPVLVYHLARVGLGLVLLVAVYQFIAFFTPEVAIRRIAFLLVALGSGLGWLVLLTGWSERIGLPLDTYLPEGFNFLILLHLPHLLLAEIGLIWGLLLLLRAWTTPDHRLVLALLAGLAFFLALGVAAFYLAVIVAVPAAALALVTLLTRRLPWAEAGLTALALALTLPLVLYNVWVFAMIPAYRIFGEQSVVRSPAPVHYLLAYGLLALLAIPGARQFWQKRELPGLFLIAWVCLVPFLVYLPFNQQRRLAMGVQLPLAILAATGLYALTRRHPRLWRRGSLALVVVASLTNVLLILGSLATLSQRQFPIFHSRPEVEARQWLAQAANGQVILALHETGNMLPAYTGVRVFVGHGPETSFAETKGEQARLFFSRSVDDPWRQALLAEYGIRYVYYGPREKTAGDFAPAGADYLLLRYSNEAVEIYEVEP